jgi:putative FmdB family regulatory protein
MPIYEYRCTQCQRTVEVIQKFSDAPLTSCEACAGRMEKLISKAAFQLKGGGWYINDYSASSSPAAPEGGSKPAESTPSSDKKASGGCGTGSCGCAN